MNNSITTLMVLFSSGGLYALTLNARYIHMLGRLRQLYDANIDSNEIEYIKKQSLLLKYSFILLLGSAILAILYVLGNVLLFGQNILTFILVSDLILIIISMIFFLIEILISRNSIILHINHKKI
ncbi:MAG: DUF2721 domain-containing protein [Bacilli bacterium]|nr:DUF2721 domain-containing protein [Bacilli bacterium]